MAPISQTEPAIIEGALILIVDDTPANLQLLGSLLGKEGYRVAAAAGGSQALAIAARSVPDLVLLDIMMPEMDGFEVCANLKADPITAHIPVIFLSAKTSARDKVRGFEVGGEDYVTKPFDTREVVARVRTHLQLKFAMERIQRYNDDLEVLLAERTRELVRSERQAAFGLLIQGIVHNMNGPLGAIGICIHAISDYRQKAGQLESENARASGDQLGLLLADIGESNQLIGAAHKKLAHMVDSMLARSRADKSDELELVDLNEIVRRELEFLEADLSFKHDVTKQIGLSPSDLTVEVVPAELAQVFQNLVRNALDALYGQSAGAITIRTGGNNGHVWGSVGDNGPGIPPDVLPRVFEPFFTTKAGADDDTASGPKGTGLGLHYCREVVESYDGRLDLEAEEGQGVLATVRLPRAGT